MSGGLRVLAEQCETCIFRPGNLMHLAKGRVAGMVRECTRRQTFIPCHETMVYDDNDEDDEFGPERATGPVCRGFYDAHGHVSQWYGSWDGSTRSSSSRSQRPRTGSQREPRPEHCVDGGGTHAWESKGLDVNADGELVNVRRCVWCGGQQEKPYGAGSRRGWRRHKQVPAEAAS